MFWKQRSLLLPLLSPVPSNPLVLAPNVIPFSRRYISHLHCHEFAHPIFSVFEISAPRKRGWDCKTGCSASFFNYVQPPLGRATLQEVCLLCLSATLRLLLPPPDFSPSFHGSLRNSLTSSFYLYIR